MSAGCDLTPALDRHSLPRDRSLLHHERREPLLWAVFLDEPELLDTCELLAECADPAEAGRDRIGLGPDVVPVQRVADLEPERVARTQPRRRDAALHDSVPELGGILGGHH